MGHLSLLQDNKDEGIQKTALSQEPQRCHNAPEAFSQLPVSAWGKHLILNLESFFKSSVVRSSLLVTGIHHRLSPARQSLGHKVHGLVTSYQP